MCLARSRPRKGLVNSAPSEVLRRRVMLCRAANWSTAAVSADALAENPEMLRNKKTGETAGAYNRIENRANHMQAHCAPGRRRAHPTRATR